MQRRHASRYRVEHAFDGHRVFWATLTYFFSSSPCRSTSGERCRHLQILLCKCRVWLPSIQGRKPHKKTDRLLSCHNNLPWGNLLWLLFGAIDCPIKRFLFRLTFFAIFADSVKTNFHFINSAGESLPQRFGVNHQTLRA